MQRYSQKLSDIQDAEPIKYAFLFRIHLRSIESGTYGKGSGPIHPKPVQPAQGFCRCFVRWVSKQTELANMNKRN